MKKALLTIFFVFLSIQSIGQQISESTTISLLTGSPGAELYSTFGHSAIRIKDESQRIDIVYNYGTFDFNTPNFYVKFVRGQLDYKLSLESFGQLKSGFLYENRSVVEQVLNLTTEQKRKLYQLIQENYLPENRYYKYDFFFDNCATRIRDLMIIAFGDDFHYNLPDEWSHQEVTFRNLIDLYLTNHHWSDFGIDIALGMPTDAVASPEDYMFLPDYLADGFATASIVQNGEEVPFVKSTRTIIPRTDAEPDVFMITPVRLMWSLLIFSILWSIFSLKRRSKMYWFDLIFFSVLGVLGWVVFLLWFYTDHIATKDNLNLLWAVPIYFPLFFFWHRLAPAIRKWILLIFGGIDVLILIFWWGFPQSYHVAFIPLILIVLLRFGIHRKSSQKASSN